LIISSLAMLVAGIVIGNAARKRIERVSHAHP
jgi:F0F1-type ATP synthase membrane subunit c/vacuolar-type H+-ATPase subunit K